MRPLPAEHPMKDALRIQAAAVAAQQAGLTEQELGLQQRRLALEQQENQLAAHLEEKRRRLLAVRDQARQERAGLEEERAAHEQRLTVMNAAFAQARADIAAGEQHVRSERRRLLSLRQRLKRRWHRHWTAERITLRQQEEELAGQHRRLEKDTEQLQRDRAAFDQERLRCNGEVELERRQLQAGWAELHDEQEQGRAQREQDLADLREQALLLEQREAAVAEAVRQQDAQQQQWQQTKVVLQQEVQGLENRVANQRRKFVEQERELARLEQAGRELQSPPVRAVPPVPPAPALPVLASVEETLPPFVRVTWTGAPRLEQEKQRLRQTEAELQQRVAALEKLSGKLSDQRLHLAEQSERLLQAQQSWQQDRASAATELEKVSLGLHEREQELVSKERGQQTRSVLCAQREQELGQLQRYLEGLQTRLTARTSTWEGERDRRLVELRTREDLAVRQLAAIAGLRQRWLERRRQEVDRLRAEHAACVKLRQECVALRERWLRRLSLLQLQQRELAEQVQQAQESGPGKSDLDRLRRLTALSNAAAQVFARERQALAAESTDVEERFLKSQKRGAQLLLLEEDLGKRVTAWERDRLLAASEVARLRQELHGLRGQRDGYEAQLATLSGEVERLVQLFLEDAGTPPRQICQAA